VDVRCVRCQTVYEVDDDRVSPGTPVQCSSCGHVFKLEGPAEESPFARASTPVKGDDWLVRRPNGDLLRLRELTTLQKWIVERKVTRDDEISKTGRTWKRLGQIPELHSFFQVVEAADAADVGRSQPPSVASPDLPPQLPPNAWALVSGEDSVEPSSLLAPPAEPVTTVPSPTITRTPTPPPLPALPTTARVTDDSDSDLLPRPRSSRSPWGRLLAAGLLGMVLAAALVVRFWWTEQQESHDEQRTAVERALAAAEIPALDDLVRQLEATAKTDDSVVPLQARLRAQQAFSWRLCSALDADIAQLTGSTAAAASDTPLSTLRQETMALLTVVPKGISVAVVDHALAQSASLLLLSTSATTHAQMQEQFLRAKRVEVNRERPLLTKLIDEETRTQLLLAEAVSALDRGTLMDAPAALAQARAKLELGDDARVREAMAVVDLRAVVVAHVNNPTAALPAMPSSVSRMPDNVTKGRADALWQALVASQRAASTPPPPEVVQPADGSASTASSSAATASAATSTTPAVSAMPPLSDLSVGELRAAFDRAAQGGQTWRAFTVAKKIVEREPNAESWVRLGWASIDVNRMDDALRSFQRATRLDGGLAEAHLGVAEANRFLGNKAAAKESYETFLRLAPNSREASIAKAALKGLTP
jgi:predicted Zn finger-like uncharacterized protein